MPNRIIKESIRESASIDMLSHAAECTWYRLVTHVDDYGLFKANVRLINRALFPLRDYSDEDVGFWMSEIGHAGMVVFYHGEDGKPYGKIVNWEEHNKPRNSNPKYPQPHADAIICNDMQELEDICMQLHANENDCAQLKKVRARTRERSSIRSRNPSSIRSRNRNSCPEQACSDPPPPNPDPEFSPPDDEPDEDDITDVSDDSQDEPVLEENFIPLKDGNCFEITPELTAEWQAAYPDIDVPKTLPAIRQWNITNRRKRKTPAGIERHITNWLAGEQKNAAMRSKVTRLPDGSTVNKTTIRNLESTQRLLQKYGVM